MTALQNTRHETFAQLLAVGAAKVHAYAAAFPQAGWVTANCKGPALARRSEVAARVTALLTKGTREAVWQLSGRLEYLRGVALTPYSALSEDSIYCQGTRHTPHGKVHRMPDKISAVKLYSRLAGDLVPPPEQQWDSPPSSSRESRQPEHALQAALAPDHQSTPDWQDVPAWRMHQAAQDFAAQQNRLAEYLQPQPSPLVLEILTNARHERFAHLVGSGESIADAYQQIYHAPRETALSQGYRVAHRPDVARRIACIQGEGTHAIAWPLPERLRYLQGIITTPIGHITPDSCYCQGIWPNRYSVEMRMPDKLRAIDLYSRLNGDLQKMRRHLMALS